MACSGASARQTCRATGRYCGLRKALSGLGVVICAGVSSTNRGIDAASIFAPESGDVSGPAAATETARSACAGRVAGMSIAICAAKANGASGSGTATGLGHSGRGAGAIAGSAGGKVFPCKLKVHERGGRLSTGAVLHTGTGTGALSISDSALCLRDRDFC